jgi:hypothetical protein
MEIIERITHWMIVKYAEVKNFQFVRSDRGADEFVATDWWPDPTYKAYTIGNAIFWPSKNAMRNKEILAHEMCHVRQNKKHGFILFNIRYWYETVRNGYQGNKFEKTARGAERRVARKSGK